MRIVVRHVRKTSQHHPAQWHGMTADDRHVYVRYRWGHLQVGIGDTFDDAVSDESILSVQRGGPYDGELPYADLVEATQGTMQWPESER